MLRVCITSLYAYPLFNPEVESPFGGSEVRVAQIAKGLAREGDFDVRLIVFDHGQGVEVREGVTIHAWPGFKCPIPARTPPPTTEMQPVAIARQATEEALTRLGLFDRLVAMVARFRKARQEAQQSPEVPRVVIARIGPHEVTETSVSFFKSVDADIYMMPGNSTMSAELSSFCRASGKPYVMLSGSDGDFHPDYKLKPEERGIYGLPGYLMVATIENANLHLVQNEAQAGLLKSQYGREATIIKNPIPLERTFPKTDAPSTILWVGKSDWIKRPGLFLDLAEKLPQFRFRMIMTYSNRAIWDATHERAGQLPNVELLDYVPFDQIERYFAEARLFVSTSVFEGFPNTFLQAAKYGAPVVSLNVDPAGMLSQRGCGIFCDGDEEKLGLAVQSLMENPGEYDAAAVTILRYVREEHDPERISEQYVRALKALLKTKAA